MQITQEIFGTLPDGQKACLFTLTNAQGMQAKITDYGAILTSLLVPDARGQLGEVVLGYNSLDQYLSPAYIKNNPYFGAIVGRFGNRIAKGKFSLNGRTHQLDTNNGPNHLHGGKIGFSQVLWTAEPLPDQNALRLIYTSTDGEEGYPGTLQTTVLYTLTPDNELKLEYHATTDQATPVNLTHHSYFNLALEKTTVLAHELTLHADRFTVVDDAQIPTGELRETAGTAMDFSKPQTIGSRIHEVEGGYDHNYVLLARDTALRLAATVVEAKSGRKMEVLTTEPGLQFYTANFLDSSLPDRQGLPHQNHEGFCLEAQHFPDSPNQPDFPNTILHPGEEYRQTTIYRFSTIK